MRHSLRIAPAALLVALAACSDLLVEEPKGFVGPENFYRTAADAEAAITSVYSPMVSVGNNYRNALWRALDMASDVSQTGPNVNQLVNVALGKMTWTPDHGAVTGNWDSFYLVITRANVVLERVPAISMNAERRSTILGEARFLRALSYFNLVRLFGDVPLIRTEADALNADVTRAPAADVYAQVLEDATEAAELLPVSWTGANLGRATRGAALTLLADAHLTRQEWQLAADLSKQVIDLGVYRLYDNYLHAFLPSHESGPEHVFSLKANGVTTATSSEFVNFYYPRQLGVGLGGGFSTAVPTKSHYASYLAGDYRKEVSYWTTGTNINGRTSTFVPHVYKYRPSQTTAPNLGDVDFPIYRYAEVLLIHAEALNELGQTAEAVTYLNMIRARARKAAGTARTTPGDYAGPVDQASVREAIFQERKWELAHEPKRWFDLIRRGEAYFMAQLRANDPQAVPEPFRMLWPVPQSEIDLNPALTQNPGY